MTGQDVTQDNMVSMLIVSTRKKITKEKYKSVCFKSINPNLYGKCIYGKNDFYGIDT